ncbi:MAG: M42 family metallopeptidase [Armatimonadetes bacterium]|nr:M42 family metallopeptidase [Armatimonadota bacterium]
MKQQTLTLLKALSEVNGVPGYEARVAKVVEEHLAGIGRIERDNLGNIICTKGDSGPKVMLAGHMDEIGFIVKHITDKGFVKFHNLGGWLDQVVLSQRVVIETAKGPVEGIIGAKPPHLTSADERGKMVTLAKMFIDVGAKDRKQAQDQFGIQPGDPIVVPMPFTPLKNRKLLMGKGWDDRVGVALMVDALKAFAGRKHPNVLVGVGTVQEEVGLRGAQTAAQTVSPDVALILETAIAGDVPDVDENGNPGLGTGAAIYVFEGSAIPNTRLRDLAIETAKKHKIKHEVAFLAAGGTDAGRIHVHARGVPCLVLGVPTRHIHTPAGILHADDYDATLRLVVELIKLLDAKTVAGLTKP